MHVGLFHGTTALYFRNKMTQKILFKHLLLSLGWQISALIYLHIFHECQQQIKENVSIIYLLKGYNQKENRHKKLYSSL